ncbi:hypothetical protein FH728_24495, partial [Bacteroides thetaiotaomicron]|nr:hypothetical protein [Bacteroides thetaiotaomicron]
SIDRRAIQVELCAQLGAPSCSICFWRSRFDAHSERLRQRYDARRGEEHVGSADDRKSAMSAIPFTDRELKNAWRDLSAIAMPAAANT